MRTNQRIPLRIRGARLRRFFYRALLFLSFIAFYCIFTGAELPGGGVNLFGIVLLIVLCAFPVAGFFIKRSERQSHRSMQLTSEVTEHYPAASRDELYKAFRTLRRREMRLEALLYCLFAAFTALVVNMLYQSGASAFSVWAGIVVVIPVLLIISAALLIASFIPFREEEEVPYLNDYLKDPEKQKALSERLERPDRRDTDYVYVAIKTNEPPAPAVAFNTVKAAAKAKQKAVMIRKGAAGFFVWLPFAITFLSLIISLAAGSLSWMFLFGFILTLFGSFMMMLETLQNGRRTAIPSKVKAAVRKVDQRGGFIKDNILSVIPDIYALSTLEICLSHTGTVRWCAALPGYKTSAGYNDFLKARGRDAVVLLCDGFVLGLFLINSASEEAAPGKAESAAYAAKPAPVLKKDAADKASPAKEDICQNEAPPAEDTSLADILKIVNSGALPTDEQIHSACLKRLAAMAPAKRETFEDELIEYMELSERSRADLHVPEGGMKMTIADESRYSVLPYKIFRHSQGDKYANCIRFENRVLKDGFTTREDIRSLKENLYSPFCKEDFLPLLILALAGLVGIPITALIEKHTGTKLTFVHVILSTITGLCAFRFAGNWLGARNATKDIRKLKKAYTDPRFWDEKIDVEAYNELRRQTEELWKSQREDQQE